MYRLKEELNEKELLRGRTKTFLAGVIGISRAMLYAVMKRKLDTTKVTAYSITKALDRNLEIEDLFDRVGD